MRLTIKVEAAWWVRPYINAVALFAWTFGMEPDLDKVAKTCMRGITLKAE